MVEQPGDLQRRKQVIRLEARARRDGQAGGDRLSALIFERLAGLQEYRAAGTVMAYVSFGSEVVTAGFLGRVWEDGKVLVVPYCERGRLGLFRLHSLEELAPGTLGILEPAKTLRALGTRSVDPAALDLIVVPGLAFDRQGGRVGYGKGYYDRLLAEVRPGAARAGVAFECQIFDEVPCGDLDIRMDSVVTERAVYRRSRPAEPV